MPGSLRRRRFPASQRPWRSPVALAGAPFAIAAVRVLANIQRPYVTVWDQAIIEVWVRDVGRHAVALGPFSRFGWFHPGPLLYYALALPYRLTGARSSGLVLGAILINGASVVGIAMVANRRGGRRLALWTVVALLLYLRVLGPILLRDVWNPFITVLPCLLFVLLLWSFACGDRWTLPLLAGVGSFVVQSHVGYAPVVATGCATALVLTASRIRHSHDGEASWHDLRRPALGAAAVGLVLWIPPIIEQFHHSPGNLTELARFASAHGFEQPWHALRDLWVSDTGAFAASLVGRRPKVGLDGADYFSVWPALVTLAAFALGLVLACRRRDRTAIALGVFSLVFAMTAMFAISHIVGGAFEYTHKWATIGGFLAFLLAGWMLVEEARRSERLQLLVDRTLAAAGVVLTLTTAVSLATSEYPNATLGSHAAKVSADIHRGLRTYPGARVSVQSAGRELSALFWVHSVANELDRHNVSVLTFAPATDVLPARFRKLDPTPEVTITIVGDRDATTFIRQGTRRIAHADGVSFFIDAASSAKSEIGTQDPVR